MDEHAGLPLISVIIPTYNYAQFLLRAVDSVLHQTYKNFELLVIDDGSVDDTACIIKQCDNVKYFYQPHQGLSAARNTGIKKSSGKYLVFLDADDWLEKDALTHNYFIIADKPQLAFVSGNYYLLKAKTNNLFPVTTCVADNHYLRLLQCNYIGMHATVMFCRWVFDQFCYDEKLEACEDYDLYLNITRKYPVQHHDKFIATYYFQESGISHKYEIMMRSVKAVIEKQAPYIKTEEEQCAYRQGLQQWKDYYQLMKQ